MVPRRAEHAWTGQLHRPETDPENTETAEGVTLHAPSLGNLPKPRPNAARHPSNRCPPVGNGLNSCCPASRQGGRGMTTTGDVRPQLRADGVRGADKYRAPAD